MTTVAVEGRELRLTNLDKILYPAAGFTKAQVIDYYVAVSAVLLPHLARRPVTLRRFPDGVGGTSWHQNECRQQPNWFPVFETSGRGGRILRFCLVDGLASLVWVANNGALEVHPFLWRTDEPRVPTQLVLDLDPGPPAGLVEAARVALLARPLLEEVGLAPLVKATGSLGLHVHAAVPEPMDTKALARAIAERLAHEHPDLVVGEMKRAVRAGRVYVDWLQNDPTRQTVAPYSLRGVPVPTVAAPLRWDEVERAVEDGRPQLLVVTPGDALERIERDGDLFAALL